MATQKRPRTVIEYNKLYEDSLGYQYRTRGPGNLDPITTYYIRKVDDWWQVSSETCDWCNSFTRNFHGDFKTFKEVEEFLHAQNK